VATRSTVDRRHIDKLKADNFLGSFYRQVNLFVNDVDEVTEVFNGSHSFTTLVIVVQIQILPLLDVVVDSFGWNGRPVWREQNLLFQEFDLVFVQLDQLLESLDFNGAKTDKSIYDFFFMLDLLICRLICDKRRLIETVSSSELNKRNQCE